jgi:superoxide dismutase
MYSVLSYITVNLTIYDTNMKQIVLALSYMREGTAAIWAQNFYTKAYASGTATFRTMEDFWKEFKKSFGSVDQKITAMTKLKHLTQGSSTTEYIAELKTLTISDVSHVTPIFESSKLRFGWSHLDHIEGKCISLQYFCTFMALVIRWPTLPIST